MGDSNEDKAAAAPAVIEVENDVVDDLHPAFYIMNGTTKGTNGHAESVSQFSLSKKRKRERRAVLDIVLTLTLTKMMPISSFANC